MGPFCHRPKMHIWRVRGSKVQEIRIKHNCTCSDEKFSSCDLLDVRKKVPAPVYKVSPVSILLGSAGFTKLHQKLCSGGLLRLATVCPEKHAIVCCI